MIMMMIDPLLSQAQVLPGGGEGHGQGADNSIKNGCVAGGFCY